MSVLCNFHDALRIFSVFSMEFSFHEFSVKLRCMFLVLIRGRQQGKAGEGMDYYSDIIVSQILHNINSNIIY